MNCNEKLNNRALDTTAEESTDAVPNSVAVAHAHVCATLADKAKAGDRDAAKLIAQEMVKPPKSPAAARKNTPEADLLQHAVNEDELQDETQDGQENSSKRGLLRGNTKRRTLAERRKIRSAVAAWKFSDPLHREPPTLQGLADALGISRAMVVQYKKRLPNTLAEYLELCRTHTLARFMEIMDNLADKVESGDKDAVAAGKLILQDLALPEMRKPKPAKVPELPAHVLRAFQESAVQRRIMREEGLLPENEDDNGEKASAQTAPLSRNEPPRPQRY
jgi:hypothetical protein